ncbi:uncharacterized protein LOC131874365 [Cryptomeria japonica]|uniref:uncharacterized protein LOC131874365 n=1 Tax=Cryptomeria japonica TaxID=3369 RepID=UPI0027DA21E9|nr:uncharacterized protein LOC131874365 [Cryptomeria japonica]
MEESNKICQHCKREGHSKDTCLIGPKGKAVETMIEDEVTFFASKDDSCKEMRSNEDENQAMQNLVGQGEASKAPIITDPKAERNVLGDSIIDKHRKAAGWVEEAITRVERAVNILDEVNFRVSPLAEVGINVESIQLLEKKIGLRSDKEEDKNNRELDGIEEEDEWGWMDEEDIMEIRTIEQSEPSCTKPDVVLLQETKMDKVEVKTLMGTWKQWSGVFVCKFHSYPLNVDFTITNVYGPSKSTLQKVFWRTLSSLIRDLEGDLLIIGGEFNAILELSDKLGGKGEIPANLAHFQNFVTKNGLKEIKSTEGQYTWSNQRISGQHVAEKLDCFFLGGPWAETNLLFASNVHPMTTSDHLPVELSITVDGALEVCGTKAFIFVKKLQFIKSKIKEWNRVKFGNIFANKRDLENKLESLQEDIIQKGMTSKKFWQERELKGQYSEVLAREEIYWRNKITTILNSENVVLDKVEDINKEVVDLFLSLLSKDNESNVEQQQEGLNVIPKLITATQNQALMKPIQVEEVRNAVFSMEGDKAPRSDGFPTFFYQNLWEVVGFEVWEVVEESRSRASVAKDPNCTLIALIPKMEHPTNFSKF